jgi:hypothetical protein
MEQYSIIFLQDPTIEKIMAVYPIWNYGVLGFFSLVMIILIRFLGKQFLKLHNQNLERILMLEKRIDEQQKKVETYLGEDRAIILDALKHSQVVIQANELAMITSAKAIDQNSIILNRLMERG